MKYWITVTMVVAVAVTIFGVNQWLVNQFIGGHQTEYEHKYIVNAEVLYSMINL